MATCPVHQSDARDVKQHSEIEGVAATTNLGTIAASSPREMELANRLYQQIHDVISGRRFFDKYSADAMCMRILLMIGAIQGYFREERPDDKAALIENLHDILDEMEECKLYDQKIRSFFLETIRYLETTPPSAPLQRFGWNGEELSEAALRIPTMLCKETQGYYKWLARTFEGPGDIVELGCWMGSTTACLAEGLSQKLWRGSRTIHVYDSFIWRDWMKIYTEDAELLAANICEGDSFLDYFWTYAEPYRDVIDVHQSVVPTGREQFAFQPLEWRGGQIGILVMDLADDRASNEAMWRIFSPSFQTGCTIIVFNQFGNIPAGEVREFCREKNLELVPLHKPCGSAKAFRYQRVANDIGKSAR